MLAVSKASILCLQKLCGCSQLMGEQTLQSVVFQQRDISELKSQDEVIEAATAKDLVSDKYTKHVLT